ncbi:YceI family protein [Zavarzinia compransoris]|uniref:YceI family protein n=1 Tax=Zavarzinia compransoris TaxID=1264899 RepID=UPI001414FAFD|nr:YceI family protein [Zavarzinia compransoris]
MNIVQLAVAALVLGAVPARAGDLYRIQPGTTTIAFAVDAMGLFETTGEFEAFEGNLLLDLKEPERSRVEVRVDTTSVATDSSYAGERLRSADYFDVERYPVMRFRANAVTPLDAGRVAITGDLTIRDVTRPQTLEASLTDRRFDPAAGAEVANFTVTGKVDRAAFGMVADQGLVSDDVALSIRAHIRLAQ